MKSNLKHSLIFLITSIILVACSTTRSVPEGDKLYTGADVTVEGTGLKAREKKVLRNDLEGLTRPRPNARFLGIPFKLLIWNMLYKSKENSFFGRLRNRLGEPPVLLSSLDLEFNEKVLESHLENKGFFNAKVDADTNVKKKKAEAVYNAMTGQQYQIRSVQYEADSSELINTIREAHSETLLKEGEPFDLDLIKGERVRIDGWLKERGYYYFSPNYLLLKVDSTSGNYLVDMRMTLKPETPPQAALAYRINDVFIYSGYRLDMESLDSSMAYATEHKGYHVIDRRNRFKPKMFEQALQFQPGDLYNRTDHNRTLNRLMDLDEFKFVNNRFENLPDSSKLDVYYYLTPLPKKSLRLELNLTNKSNNLSGTEISGTWLNRNTFRAGEHLEISAYAGTEIQFGGNFRGYNTYRGGAEAAMSIPRFFVPFFDIHTIGGYVPRTYIRLGYDLLNRRKLYTLNSFNFGFGYEWQESPRVRHEFYPVSINYVQPLNVTEEYRDSIIKYPYLNVIIDSQFIIGSTYQYNYNGLAQEIQGINSFYFNGLIDLSGNIAGLLTGSGNENKRKTLFNTAFDQYLKFETDGRYYRKIGLRSTWANRVIVGYSIPYGNSRQLPYIKQFFSGGNNSIRAFRSRSLLGTYRFPDTSNFLPDQTGDIKFEVNTEFRPHISGPLYGALFIDAGNTWLKNTDPDRPGAKFEGDFLSDLAIGTGIGLRLDIQLFVIRLDVAFPLRKPWEGELKAPKLGDGQWRQDNLIWNLAIGYPF